MRTAQCIRSQAVLIYNPCVSSAWRRFVRFGFTAFYNRFAFTYDTVSAIVSRGEWRKWTRAALPNVRGTRILEIAFGTGNLHLDLYNAGYTPIGIDFSPYMHDITRAKFQRRGIVPRLARADVRALPFPDNSFSSLVMTFPPGFMSNPKAVAEMYRVLEPEGVLVWVDAPALVPRDAWSRFLNWAFSITGSDGADADALIASLGDSWQNNDAIRWTWRVEVVSSPTSRVYVLIATKQGQFFT